MKVLITGICGFVGSSLAKYFAESKEDVEVLGFDNFSRSGSYLNKPILESHGCKIFFADMRAVSDMDQLPAVDWIIDAAANPSVRAGLDGKASSRQLIEHNLLATANLLEYARIHKSGLIMLSTSRVYSIKALREIELEVNQDRFVLRDSTTALAAISDKGLSDKGIAEGFSTSPPISLYGASKLCSEILALEYAANFEFPVWINRCGVLAGAGQFGRADQGIISFWINSRCRKQALKYTGFGGAGQQVRDCLHPRDLFNLILLQMNAVANEAPPVVNVSGGKINSVSLLELNNWCDERFGVGLVASDKETHSLDAPWLVLDSSLAETHWHWRAEMPLAKIFEEIAEHAEKHPDWLKISNS